jgi:hypothetical protein
VKGGTSGSTALHVQQTGYGKAGKAALRKVTGHQKATKKRLSDPNRLVSLSKHRATTALVLPRQRAAMRHRRGLLVRSSQANPWNGFHTSRVAPTIKGGLNKNKWLFF